jgi:hypothetical protein
MLQSLSPVPWPVGVDALIAKIDHSRQANIRLPQADQREN